jgi:hypothetical protein
VIDVGDDREIADVLHEVKVIPRDNHGACKSG